MKNDRGFLGDTSSMSRMVLLLLTAPCWGPLREKRPFHLLLGDVQTAMSVWTAGALATGACILRHLTVSCSVKTRLYYCYQVVTQNAGKVQSMSPNEAHAHSVDYTKKQTAKLRTNIWIEPLRICWIDWYQNEEPKIQTLVKRVHTSHHLTYFLKSARESEKLRSTDDLEKTRAARCIEEQLHHLGDKAHFARR